MRAITLLAPAKVNLILEILGKRPDGYHELKTIMHSLELADTLTFKQHGQGIKITCDHPGVPQNSDNLVYKAAQLLKAETKVEQGVHIHIKKRIPVAAGMGGGSSDAATALRGLVKFWGIKTRPDLIKIAKQLGSDVPFFLQGGCVLAVGRGEKLKTWPAFPRLPLVVVNPGISVATAVVYKKFSLGLTSQKAYINMMRLALIGKNPIKLSRNLFNHLELVTEKLVPQVREIKQKLLQSGAIGVLMTGSGPTVFGVMPSVAVGKKIVRLLKREYPLVVLTRTSGKYSNFPH
jgi:4-diphosphocytidyl-2-C-methyl-D-erythritol kinase